MFTFLLSVSNPFCILCLDGHKILQSILKPLFYSVCCFHKTSFVIFRTVFILFFFLFFFFLPSSSLFFHFNLSCSFFPFVFLLLSPFFSTSFSPPCFLFSSLFLSFILFNSLPQTTLFQSLFVFPVFLCLLLVFVVFDKECFSPS